MTLALACALVAVVVAALRRESRRADLLGAAVHELRGSATAISLAAAALRREPGGLRRAMAFESELERMRAALEDLELARLGRRSAVRPAVLPAERLLRGAAAGWRPAARRAGRPFRFRWEGEPADVRADRGRMAQALGNLLANALEHGSGAVELVGRRRGDRVRLEVTDRGRGLGIAARAVEEAGGSLTLEHGPEVTTAAIELPVADP